MKLSEVAELTVGFVGTMAEHYTDSGVPFLRSLNVKPYYIDDTDIKYISSDFCSKISKSILHTDDIIIVRTGVPGTCCVVPENYNGCNCSDVVIVRPNKEKVEPHFLAAYINIWGQKQIHNNRVGAVQKHFNVHSAEELLISLPDIYTQRKIADLIKYINGLIQNNTQINDNLSYQSDMVA
ncbi:MAG: restriction endonuclease subunit S [Ruminococcus sp.]|uniref:restriction endonuclease subunit S n=1 Tax=Ruminococcus sp. TaxID=41978 RepID=UPI0025EA5911|nr:restriction endonuclease subunit S [Ruminococcus sp.]MCR5540105.1 restriction endonuclease subunit S [Ruminococcus sp.]